MKYKHSAICLLLFFTGLSFADTSLSACANLTATDTYTLNQSVSISGATCFNITAVNVTFNCAGFSITGNNSTGTYGVYSGQSYTTVKNCNIGNFSTAIQFKNSGFNRVTNSSISTTYTEGPDQANLFIGGFGISFISVENSSIDSNYIFSPFGAHIFTVYTDINLVARNNTVANNIITGDRFFMKGSYDSHISNNKINASDGWWLVVNGDNDTVENNLMRGIGGNGVIFYIGTEGPLTPSPQVGNFVINNTIITTGDGVMGGWQIRKVLIENNTLVGDGATALMIDGGGVATNLTVRNNNMTSATNTVFFAVNSLANNNVFTSNNITATSNYPIYYEGGNYDNQFFSNIINATAGTDIYIPSGNGTFINNTIAGSVWANIGGSATFNNSTTGNRYYFANGTEAWGFYNITDSNGDHWADGGNNRPFNATLLTGGQWTGNGADWFPWTGTSGCGNINTAGATNALSNNISINGATCFNVTAANVTIDCSGYSVTGNNTATTYGIYSNQLNTTVRNCAISNFASNAYFNGASNSAITNSNFSTGPYGFASSPLSYCENFHSILLTNLQNVTVANNNIFSSSNSTAACFDSVSYVNFSCNSIVGASGFNYVRSNYTTVAYNNISSVNGSLGVTFGPQNGATTNKIGYFNTFTHNSITVSNIPSNSNAVRVRANVNMTISYNTIYSDTLGGLLFSTSTDNASVLYNNITYAAQASSAGTPSGLIGPVSGTVQGNIIRAGYGYGLFALYSSPIFKDNIISSNNSTALYSSTSGNSIFVNNTFTTLNASSPEVLLVSCTNDTFYWNNFTNTSGLYVNDSSGANYYNTSINGQPAGNIWFNVMNGSIKMNGSVPSPFTGLYYASSGTGYPYNNTTSQQGTLYKLAGNVTDYAPLVYMPPANVTLSSPANGFSTSNANPSFAWNAVSTGGINLNCILYIDGGASVSGVTEANGTLYSTMSSSLLSLGSHTWYVACGSAANAIGSSDIWSITITQIANPTQNTNNGGGSIPAPYVVPVQPSTQPAEQPTSPPTQPAEPPAQEITPTSASAAVTGAEAALNNAIGEGKDVSSAIQKLNEAKAALEEGDYEKAAQLAQEALSMAESAKTKQSPSALVNQEAETTLTPAQKDTALGIGAIFGILALVAVAGIAVFLFLGRRKKVL